MEFPISVEEPEYGRFVINQVKNDPWMQVYLVEHDWLTVEIIARPGYEPRIFSDNFDLVPIDAYFMGKLILFARHWALDNLCEKGKCK